jgi:hypothetical protein
MLEKIQIEKKSMYVRIQKDELLADRIENPDTEKPVTMKLEPRSTT